MSANDYPVEEHELRRAADSLHAFNYTSDANTVESALIELLALRARVAALERDADMLDCGELIPAEIAARLTNYATTVGQLRARVAELEAAREGIRNAVAVAIDDHVPDENMRARIRLAIAAELLITAAATGEPEDCSNCNCSPGQIERCRKRLPGNKEGSRNG